MFSFLRKKEDLPPSGGGAELMHAELSARQELVRHMPGWKVLQRDVFIVRLCQELNSRNPETVLAALMQLGTLRTEMRLGTLQREAIATAVMHSIFRGDLGFDSGQTAVTRNMAFQIALELLPKTYGVGRLQTMIWEGLDFRSTSFSGVKLKGLNFTNCCFDAVNFMKSQLRQVRFVNCSMKGAVFIQSAVRSCDFVSCDLSSANFFGAKLSDSALPSCEFASASFATASMDKLLFNGSTFTGVSLRSAVVRGCDFSNAVNLDQYRLQEADYKDILYAPSQLHEV